MNASTKVLRLSQIAVRQLSKSAPTEASTGTTTRLKTLQQKFQIEDGVPVYIKGGVGDRILFATTVGLITIGLGLCGETVYSLINK